MLRSSTRASRALVGACATAVAFALLVPAASSAALRKTVQPEYTLLRSDPGSYVIGTAYQGWTVDVQGDAVNGYRWGHVYGNVNDCVWIWEGAFPAGGESVPDNCRHSNRSVSGFTNGQVSANSTDGDTAHVNIYQAGCDYQYSGQALAYGNVKPWRNPAEPSDYLYFGRPHGDYILWRYVSNDGNWVMVREPEFGENDGTHPQNWFFLDRQCVNLY